MCVFKKIDTDGSKTIDKAETLKFWYSLKRASKLFANRKSNFAKLNTNELFKAVDADNNGTISESEWLEFWYEVKRSGHSEAEIEAEVVLKKWLKMGKWISRLAKPIWHFKTNSWTA